MYLPKNKDPHNKKWRGTTVLQYVIFFGFVFLATPYNAQGLSLSLHSGITFGSNEGTIWDARNENWAGHMQGKHHVSSLK